MIRVTIDLIPQGDESQKRTLGLIEIANAGGDRTIGHYAVALKKSPPFSGALLKNWRRAMLEQVMGDEDILAGAVHGFQRTRLGVYDLVYRALRACDLHLRNGG